MRPPNGNANVRRRKGGKDFQSVHQPKVGLLPLPAKYLVSHCPNLHLTLFVIAQWMSRVKMSLLCHKQGCIFAT
jgi:hypothetical protein